MKRHSFQYAQTAFPQNVHSRKFGEIIVFSVVFIFVLEQVLGNRIQKCKIQLKATMEYFSENS